MLKENGGCNINNYDVCHLFPLLSSSPPYSCHSRKGATPHSRLCLSAHAELKLTLKHNQSLSWSTTTSHPIGYHAHFGPRLLFDLLF